jgi:poly(A) polymerase
MSAGPPENTPAKPACTRDDALHVVRRLREAGHVAYFAGGCVRDLLLGREAKDFDVATNAPPDRVRSLFHNTQAVGAAFGVILVRRGGSQVEVATFRTDGEYADGRRPNDVRFSTAEEDAQRRDFTINGLFLDPLDGDRVIDFVGGQQDLRERRIRAIGEPQRRFEEDHLRLLRAVRFAARLGFELEPATAAAIRQHAPMLTRISPERIGDELRMMFCPPTRVAAWRLLNELELATVLFRFVEVTTGEPDEQRPIDQFFHLLSPGGGVPFYLGLATATLQWLWWASPATTSIGCCLEKAAVTRLVQAMRRALKLSNEECDGMEGTLSGIAPLIVPQAPTLAMMKRFLARPTAAASRHLMAALAETSLLDETRTEALLADLAELEKEDYAPLPLITGDDLTAAGVKPGPVFKRMLDAAYDAQLMGTASTREQAMEIALALRG